jgi:transposase InsO family protein
MLAEQTINFVAASSAPRVIKMDELVEASKRDDLLQRLTEAIRKGTVHGQQPRILGERERPGAERTMCGHSGGAAAASPPASPRRTPGHRQNNQALARASVVSAHEHSGQRNAMPTLVKREQSPAAPDDRNAIGAMVSLDFYGPLANGHYLLVTNDKSTRFPVEDEVVTTSAKCTIESLDKTFSEFGIPDEIKTDNGPPFTSHEFAEFCERHGIKHRRITPLHPQANGQSENFMRNINKIVRNSFHSGYNSRLELNAFLRHTHQRTLRQPICCSSDQTIAVCQNVRQSANPSKK